MKNFFMWLIFPAIIMLVLLSSFADFVKAAGNNLTGYLISASEAESRVKGKSEGKFTPEIKINNVAAIYDDLNNAFFFTVTETEDILNAELSVSEGELFIIEQQEDEQSLTYYALIISDDTYMLTELVFTTLPIICFDIDSKTGDEYIPASFRLYDNQTQDTVILTESAGQITVIRRKGTGSSC